MKGIKQEKENGTTFLRISKHDAIEILLFAILLASIFGMVLREKFIYAIFIIIIIFIWWELRRYRKEKTKMIKKLDKRIEEHEERKKERAKKGKS
ncbi:hypothetical protein GF345_02315 [Candidatus Woesearchaeota archaeon]|nr:hypothetical protein [Candidatus Woesearchaeota archaeon]